MGQTNVKQLFKENNHKKTLRSKYDKVPYKV